MVLLHETSLIQLVFIFVSMTCPFPFPVAPVYKKRQGGVESRLVMMIFMEQNCIWRACHMGYLVIYTLFNSYVYMSLAELKSSFSWREQSNDQRKTSPSRPYIQARNSSYLWRRDCRWKASGVTTASTLLALIRWEMYIHVHWFGCLLHFFFLLYCIFFFSHKHWLILLVH